MPWKKAACIDCGAVVWDKRSPRCRACSIIAARIPIEDRFWEKVDKNGPIVPYIGTPCWIWMGYRMKENYGRIVVNGKPWLTHRLSYYLHHGPIPKEQLILHKCDNPPCVNPEHLWVGTNKDNDTDKRVKGRANSPKGEKSGRYTKPECTARGEKHWKAKLNEQQVKDIRRRWAENPTFGVRAKMSREYGVSTNTITLIIQKRIWKHI